MTIQIKISLGIGQLPLDYRRLILHFIKIILSSEDKEIYHKFYADGKNPRKPFTFWLVLPGAKFLDDKISLDKQEFTLNISSTDTKLLFILYNGFKKVNQFKISEHNIATVKSVKVKEVKPIKDSQVIIKMLSPLVIRKHLKGEQDRYMLYNEDSFDEYFKINVSSQLTAGQNAPQILPLKCKKVIVKAFGTNIPASLGVFKLSGEPEVLQKLFLIGLGSKNSAGFGKFEVID